VKGALDSIIRLNKTIVRDDGTFKSFQKQLEDLRSGIYDVTKPLIVFPNSACLSFIAADPNAPLTIRVKTIRKLQEKHHMDLAFIGTCPDLIKTSALAFDSLSQDTSKVILLDACNEEGDPYIAAIRLNRLMSMVPVHEITSIYPKKNFGSFLLRTYQADKTFYKTKKLEQIIKSQRLQLPKEMISALCNYSNHVFTKSQAERGFQSAAKRNNKLDATIQSAAKRRNNNTPSFDRSRTPER